MYENLYSTVLFGTSAPTVEIEPRERARRETRERETRDKRQTSVIHRGIMVTTGEEEDFTIQNLSITQDDNQSSSSRYHPTNSSTQQAASLAEDDERIDPDMLVP